MKRNLILTVIIGLVLTAGANGAVRQGDREFSIFIPYTDLNLTSRGGGGSESLWGIGASVGHFYSDEMRFGAQANLAFSDDINWFALGIDLKYHWMTASDTVPYLGAQISYAFADGDTADADGLTYGPLLGLKLFTDETTSVFLEYQYHWFDSALGNINRFADEAHVILLGISYKY